MRSFIRFEIQKVGCRNFFVSKSKKISFSKINLLNLRKNLVGPWGSTQLGERSPKPVSRPKSDTRKVSRPSSPQNHPTCTCTPVPRVSARDSPLSIHHFICWFFQRSLGPSSWTILNFLSSFIDLKYSQIFLSFGGCILENEPSCYGDTLLQC